MLRSVRRDGCGDGVTMGAVEHMGLRILWAVESPAQPTGYGRVARELLPRLACRGPHRYGLLAWSHRDDGCSYDDTGYELLKPARLETGRSWTAPDIEAALQQFQPDVLVTVGNLRMLESVTAARSRPFVQWIGYFPVEGTPLPSWRMATVTRMDHAVTFTSHGRQAVLAAAPESACTAVPLGVNVRRFRPLRRRSRLRRDSRLASAFVVGTVARNQPRKQFPTLLEAFGKFASRYRDAVLYLHANPFDYGWDLSALADHFDIANRTLFTSGMTGQRQVEDRELNAIYNLFDVFVLPTGAEGFGLPFLEAMAAGVPVVTTNYGAAAELVGGRGFLVEPAARLTDETSHTDLAVLDSDRLADALVHVRRRIRTYRRLAEANRTFARRHSWERCAARWRSLFDRFNPSPGPATRPV